MAQKPPASVSPEQSEAIAATGSTMLEPTETTAERRDEVASKLVDQFAIWSGVAGLIPVPVIDAVAVGGTPDPDAPSSFANLRRGILRK